MSTFVLMVISIVVTLVVSILSIIVSTSAGVDWSLKLWDDLKNRVDQRRVRP